MGEGGILNLPDVVADGEHGARTATLQHTNTEFRRYPMTKYVVVEKLRAQTLT